MTIEEAYLKLIHKDTVLNHTKGMEVNLEMFSQILEKMKRLTGDYPDYQVPAKLEKYLNNFDIYKQKDLEMLEKEVHAKLFIPTQEIEKADEWLINSKNTRKNRIRLVFYIMVTIAIGMAVAVICGIITGGEWAGVVATILGTVDFVMGILSFSWERISDMDAQSVEAVKEDLSKEVKGGTKRVIDLTKKLITIKQTKINQFTCGCFNNTKAVIDSDDSEDSKNLKYLEDLEDSDENSTLTPIK